jgi:hypothetical protein
MATIFILVVLAYFVIVSDVSTLEKFVVAMLSGIVALLPNWRLRLSPYDLRPR